MTVARYLVGDVFERMAEIPDGSIDLVLTSPPFLALRSYLPADHPDKGKEIGSEPTPAEFIDTLLALTAEWRRVLAPHGSICVELGDTYSGSGGAGGDYNDGGLREGQQAFSGSASKRARLDAGDNDRPARAGRGTGWPLAKSLTGIPTLYTWSLAYGRNLLTAQPSPAGEWRIRNLVAWARPNPPVGALGDKFRPATSYMTVACVSVKRYFDLDAVRTPPTTGPAGAERADGRQNGNGYRGVTDGSTGGKRLISDPAGAPPLDYWVIPTQPYAGSHYATWPEALLVRPIEAMCPRKVCTECGQPSTRIVGEAEYVPSATSRGGIMKRDGERAADGVNQWTNETGAAASVIRQAPTLGWTDCRHNAFRPGVVLDPFAGSGTTLAVATARGRDAIGIDLDERNLDLARQRIGMWLIEEPIGGAA